MTAEIVIMNKHGLSLAADSAITSGQDGVRKIYNSAHKLFSLSNDHPIGIMVYGSASFMEVPWDIIIKAFRNRIGSRKHIKLSDYMDEFLTYIQEEQKYNDEKVEEIIVYRIFSDVLKDIVGDVEETITKKEHEGVTVGPRYISNWMGECVARNLEYYKKRPQFLDIKLSEFSKRFSHVIEEICQEVIPDEPSKRLKNELIRLAFEVVKRDYFSLGSSGFVIAGYGEEDIFPNLLNYRLEGFVFGKLKYKKLEEKRISYTDDRDNGTATISAFGQREMVESFIYGVEPDMEDAVLGIIDKVLENYPNKMRSLLNITFTKEEISQLEVLGDTVYESIRDAIEDYKDISYLTPLLGVVRSLPVKELSEMTETLINLTSFKRRVTRVTESVGPPIDVAVITKGDGFVWLKKKKIVRGEER